MVKRAQDSDSAPNARSNKRTKAADSNSRGGDKGLTHEGEGLGEDTRPSTNASAVSASTNHDSSAPSAPTEGKPESTAGPGSGQPDDQEKDVATSSSKSASSATASDGNVNLPSTPDYWPPSARSSPVPVTHRDADLPGLPDDELRALFNVIDYVPTNVLRRLVAFTTKVDEKNRRYSIAKVPATARWGHSSRTDKFLCVDNEPITVWTLANVESTWFVDPDGNPHGRVNVGHRLPFAGDTSAAAKLFLRANPPIADAEDVRFSGRYMKRFEKGSNVPTILPFEAIYDATRHFKSKAEMKQIPSSRVGKRDIVLLESTFTRYKEGEAKKIRRWTEWKVGFELQAVSLLFEAPPGLELETQDPIVDDEDDDM